MFTIYELQILREAVQDNLQAWEDRIEQGADVSEKFMATLAELETKISAMIDRMPNHIED